MVLKSLHYTEFELKSCTSDFALSTQTLNSLKTTPQVEAARIGQVEQWRIGEPRNSPLSTGLHSTQVDTLLQRTPLDSQNHWVVGFGRWSKAPRVGQALRLWGYSIHCPSVVLAQGGT